MKSIRIFMPLLVMVSIFSSCKKDNDTSPSNTDVTYPDYSALKVGNYWIYERFDIAANGSASSQHKYDSCYVKKIVLLNGKEYFKLYRPMPYTGDEGIFTLLRDSLHYIINAEGEILFSSQDFSNDLSVRYVMSPDDNDTIVKVTRKMTDKDVSIATSAGTFVTSNALQSYNYTEPDWSFGTIRYTNEVYAEHVGIVLERLPFYMTSPGYVERRLVRYHVTP